MIYEIIKDHGMESDFESQWTPCFIDNLDKRGQTMSAYAVKIIWHGVTPIAEPKATVTMESSEDTINSATLKSQIIGAEDNSANVHTYLITQPFAYLRFKYAKGAVESGFLSVKLFYR